MARPRQCRFVQDNPVVTYFRPKGPLFSSLKEEHLCVEELEALRLADVEGLSNANAAERMRVSRHTFGRVLANARKNVARAICLGHALRIGGGHFVSLSGLPPLETVRRLAVASKGKELSSPFEVHFALASGFALIDLATDRLTYADNSRNAKLFPDARHATVSLLKELDVEAVCATRFGEKERYMLQSRGMHALECQADTVEAVVTGFRTLQAEACRAKQADANASQSTDTPGLPRP